MKIGFVVPVSQSCPVYPSTHKHVNELTPSMQVPL